MAAPVTGDTNSPPQTSDPFLIPHTSPPHPSDEDFTIAQLIRPNNNNNSLPNPPPPSPITSSLGKRRKSKPVRYDGYVVIGEKKRPLPLDDNEVEDSSSKSLSSSKGNSASKNVKSKIKTPPAMLKAAELQSSLGTENPTYIKMVNVHGETGYWIGFPQWFGRLFLPKTECEMELEDENGEIHCIKYLAKNYGFSAGWNKFAVGHNLVEGDVLVFHLVESHKFKVYIIRANDPNSVDGALGLNKQPTPETETPSPTRNKFKRAKSLSSIAAQNEHKLSTPSPQIISRKKEQSKNNSEDIGSEGSGASKPNLSVQEFKTYKNFHIMVKGVCINSELPDDVRMNYFKLCMLRKEFLHDCLSENFNHKLVAGMIGETVNIANKIKNSNLATTKEEFDLWDNSLKSFSQLGMKVGFLRDKIVELSRIVFESENRLDIERYLEAKKEHERLNDEIKRVTEKLKKLKESARKIQGVAHGLKEKVAMYEVKLQDEINALW